MFYKINLLNLDSNEINFDKLTSDINFELITTGRVGANLFSYDSSVNQIPLVRTTTIYSNPLQQYKQLHLDLINKIKSQVMSELNFDLGTLNNGLAEIYTNEYKTMGFHSDQTLDLEKNSFICIYSHYSNPKTSLVRILEIKNKKSCEKTSISLTHNSLIIFDYETNQTNLHKIILPSQSSNENDIKWFGLTLRTSKTFIKFIDSIPYILNDELKLATAEEKKEFYKLRSIENKSSHFDYPHISYTISSSDIVKPKK